MTKGEAFELFNRFLVAAFGLPLPDPAEGDLLHLPGVPLTVAAARAFSSEDRAVFMRAMLRVQADFGLQAREPLPPSLSAGTVEGVIGLPMLGQIVRLSTVR